MNYFESTLNDLIIIIIVIFIIIIIILLASFFASVLFNLGKKSWYIHLFDLNYKPMTVRRAAEIRQLDLLLSI